MKPTRHGLKIFSILILTAAGCVDDQSAAPLVVGDTVDQAELDAKDISIEPPVDESEIPTEEITDDAELDDLDIAIDSDAKTAADTIGPAYHLFTKTGATCRDHCVAHDQYIGSYGVTFSWPYYFYGNSKIYSSYYVGSSKKEIWEQHRFKRAHVDLYCGSSGQYLRKYYGRAKRGREVVRTWLCYSGSCRFLGDNVGSMYRGWKH